MRVLLHAVDRLLGGAERGFLALANVCLLLMLGLNGANIAIRAVLDTSLKWVWPWTLVLMIWMTFLGFFVVYRRAKDISVDYFVNLTGPRGRHLTRLLVDGLVLALMGVLLWEAPRVLGSQVGELELVGLQRWVQSVPLFASALLVALHYLVDLLRALSGAPEAAGHAAARDA